MKKQFPFTIRQVVDILGLTIRGSGDAANIQADCPFCSKANGKKGKLGISQAKNIFRCVYCDASGGMVELYAKAHNINNSEAYREICDLIGLNKTNYAKYEAQSTAATKKFNMNAPGADPETIHQTYAMMLASITLAEPHRKHLLDRGLTPEAIKEHGYKSVPAFGQKELCARLIKAGCTLEGVPGFYIEDGAWNVKLKAPGILIPVNGIDGKITGIQIRLNNAINDKKYVWLSSNG